MKRLKILKKILDKVVQIKIILLRNQSNFLYLDMLKINNILRNIILNGKILTILKKYLKKKIK